LVWNIIIFIILYRHQFYLHARLDLLEGRLKASYWGIIVKLVALMVQTESGDFDPVASPQLHRLYLEQGTQFGAGEDLKPTDVLHRVAVEHRGLKVSVIWYLL
jgi:hypothetical protein